jgi:hypothetical protein
MAEEHRRPEPVALAAVEGCDAEVREEATACGVDDNLAIAR